MMINILLFIISAMTIVIGIVLLLSNRHTKERMSAISFGVAVLGVALWVLFVALFRTANNENTASLYVFSFSISALIVTIGLFAYSVSFFRSRLLKIFLVLVNIIIVTILSVLIIKNPDSFFTNITLIPGGNTVETISGPLFYAYGAALGVFLVIGVLLILSAARKNKENSLKRKGLIFIASGVSVATVICGIVNIIAPSLFGYFDLFWVGPLSISIAMLLVYFATLKYRLFTNSSKALKYSTYFVAIAMAAALYICLFYLLFMLVFRGATPSDEMIIFQFTMVVIIMLFLPTISHVYSYIMKLIMDNKTPVKDKTE